MNSISLFCGFKHEEAVKRDQIAFVAYPVQTVPPGFIKAHTERRHLVVRPELRSPHGLQCLWLQDAIAVELSAVQKGLAEAAHVRSGRRDSSRGHRVENFKANGGLLRIGRVTLRR